MIQEHESSLGSDQEELPSLRFGDYNLPKPGVNKLESVQHQRVTLYTPSGSNPQAFWFPVYRDWHRLAAEIKVLRHSRSLIFFVLSSYVVN